MISKLLKAARFSWEYTLDCVQALKFNSYSPWEERQRRLFYHILINTHALEKGLSLPNPRTFFGKDKIKVLIEMGQNYDPAFDELPLRMLRGMLECYLSRHRGKDGSELPVDDSKTTDDLTRQENDQILDSIESFLKIPKLQSIASCGGTKPVTPKYQFGDNPESVDFLTSRFSCRMFDDSPLDKDKIKTLIKIAQSAPSQCNRQSSRVHIYQDKTKVQTLLELQAGSNGFREDVGNLFVVSSELTAWGGPAQRNQAFVDGALFSMFLMLACHANGIATCPLNLAKLNSDEKKIKKFGEIPYRERLIMMIAFGEPMDRPLIAARSPRMDTEKVAQFH